jgi:hypothetical protein
VKAKKTDKIVQFFCIELRIKFFFISLFFAGNPDHIRLVLPIALFRVGSGQFAVGNNENEILQTANCKLKTKWPYPIS